MNNLLVYGTGGLAVAGTKAEDSYLTSTVSVSDSATRAGWALGAGIDYKLTPAIILGAEYLYEDFGTYNYNFTTPAVVLFGGPYGINASLKLNIIKASLSYKF